MVFLTKEMMAFFEATSFHDGSGSASVTAVNEQLRAMVNRVCFIMVG